MTTKELERWLKSKIRHDGLSIEPCQVYRREYDKNSILPSLLGLLSKKIDEYEHVDSNIVAILKKQHLELKESDYTYFVLYNDTVTSGGLNFSHITITEHLLYSMFIGKDNRVVAEKTDLIGIKATTRYCYYVQEKADNGVPIDWSGTFTPAISKDAMLFAYPNLENGLQWFVCKDCGKVFYLTDDEVEWFQKKGLNIPKRCEDCRAKRRKEND